MKGVKKCQLKKFERAYFSSSLMQFFLQNAHLNEIWVNKENYTFYLEKVLMSSSSTEFIFASNFVVVWGQDSSISYGF